MLPVVDDLLSIGKFSERTGLSPKRLRDYGALGLLPPAAVDAANGYRYYSVAQLRSAQAIEVLRAAGVPLAEIATLLVDPSAAGLDTWSRRVEAEAQQRRAALVAARNLLGLAAERGTEPSELQKEGEMIFEAALRSETGAVRDENEDAALCGRRIVAVADGMGGHPGGQVAATMTLAMVEAAYTGSSPDELPAAVRAANRAVFDRGQQESELTGMGTTLSAVALTRADELVIGHVGDSRVYVVDAGAVERVTEDHTVPGRLVRQGQLTEAEAAADPRRGWLTRAVGAAPTVTVDTSVRPAAAGLRVVLCSDGLFTEVPEDELTGMLRIPTPRQELAQALVDRALATGGRDNVTVVVADLSLALSALENADCAAGSGTYLL